MVGKVGEVGEAGIVGGVRERDGEVTVGGRERFICRSKSTVKAPAALITAQASIRRRMGVEWVGGGGKKPRQIERPERAG
jgi:hypothetical protein